MARRLSNMRGLGFRAHNPDELIEHCARYSLLSFTHASAKRTRRTDVLFCMAAMSGIALWAIWKDKCWAKRWAVAASSVFFLQFP